MIQRYNRTGPRYTSYPTALEFKAVETDQEEKSLLSDRDINKPLSLYLHIPFCAHVCYYCGCNKVVTKDRSRSESYLALLKKEIDEKASHLKGNPVVEQMHWGGGTPTFLSDEQIVELFNHIKSRFQFSTADSADFSIEIDPRELRPGTLKLLRQLGFNRTSFGVQDLDEKVQKAVNRVQPESMIRAVMDEARELGFRSINIDLIYGLPHQTLESFANTVETIIDLLPDRLSVFNYAHLPERFKPQRRINEEDLPDSQQKLAILGHCIQRLTEADYHYVGMDHFARPDDELAIAQANKVLHRNFQGYTTHGDCDLIGFGVSSISQISDQYLQNTPDIKLYETQVVEGRLPTAKIINTHQDDIIRRTLIMSLLCHSEVRFIELNEQFNIDCVEYFAEELASLLPMVEDKLLEISDAGIFIQENGRLLVRNACMHFDTYLTKLQKAAEEKGERRFSKAI